MVTVATANGLFIMTRFPEPGCTKTRLIPALGADGAAQLQRQMTEYLLARFQPLRPVCQLRLEVHFAGGSARQMAQWLGDRVHLRPQAAGNLGQRISHAFEQGFATGLERILMVGSDCPGIGKDQIVRSLDQLDRHDLVIGPAEDGGYYLIGLKAPQPELFEAISWGQSCVFAETMAIAERRRLSVALLDPLPDIDRPEDLPLWEAYSGSASSRPQVRL